MPADFIKQVLTLVWPWALGGLVLGFFLERVVLSLPMWVLKPYGDQIHADDWHGPGGGLYQVPRPTRQCTLAVVNALAWASCAYAMRASATAPISVVLAWALCTSSLLVLAFVDWNTTLLPDILVLSLLWAGLLASELEWTHISVSVSLWSAAGWYVLAQLSSWLFERVTGRMGMGQGDAKLLAAMAAWWGWLPIVWAMLIGSVAVIVWACIGPKRRSHWQSPVPFGPPLILGVCLWSLVQGLSHPSGHFFVS